MTTWPVVVPKAELVAAGSTEEMSAIQKARASMLLAYAEGHFLTVVGQNYGVPRAPQMTDSDDELYRSIIPILAWRPKMIMATTYRLLEAIFGRQADLEEEGQRPWQIYEVNPNEIIFEIPGGLIATTNENASYLHGWSGYAYNATGGFSNTFTTEGDVTKARGGTLVGVTLNYWEAGTSSWQASGIAAISYDANTDITTIQLNAAVIPAGGAPFHISLTGNNVTNYRGDYLGLSRIVAVYETSAGVGTTTTVSLIGDYSRDIVNGGNISLYYNNQYNTNQVSSDATYDEPTNRTTFTVTAAIPQGQLSLMIRAMEAADGAGASTPTHNDRVYLAGYALYDVFKYYYDLLVRAAGIVVRLEIVSDYT